MARGGKRHGAGRKALLDVWERISAGQYCEELYRAICEDRKEQQRERLISPQLRKLWRRAHAVPLADRVAWTASETYEDHAAEIEIALHKIHGAPELPEATDSPGYEDIARIYLETSARRVLAVRPTRPKGVRTAIIDQAARKFGVSAGTIDKCWKEYRAFERELRSDV